MADHGRWKEGGLIIELFKTTGASIIFDRMITSGSSWLMGVKVQRVIMHTLQLNQERESPSQKFHQITGHTGEHLLRPTAKKLMNEFTGILAPCEICAQAKIRQVAIPKKKMKKLPTSPEYRIFIDICSFKQVSRGGNRHWLIAVDEFSDCSHSFFLSKTSDLIKLIPIWIKGLSRKYGIEIKRISLDNSGKTKASKKNVINKIWVCLCIYSSGNTPTELYSTKENTNIDGYPSNGYFRHGKSAMRPPVVCFVQTSVINDLPNTLTIK